jgi:hypothetical protein
MPTKFYLQIMLNFVVYTLNYDFLVPPYEQEQFKVKHGISFVQTISDYNNQMITLNDILCPLNEISFRKRNLLKLSELTILYD